MRFFSANRKSIIALASLGLIAGLSAFEHGPEDGGMAKAIGSGVPASSFTNFESAHVSPIAMTPDGTKLLAVNTANNSLEVFTLSATGMMHFASIPVGLDPVTVRARTNNEVWVVCQVSDEISIVDLTLKATIRSVATENEPADLVFAGSPQKAYVSCAERESIQVFDPANLATAPVEVLLKGEQPRALAVSPDGSTVYCAFFESGNRTTSISGNDFFSTEHVPGKIGICSTQGGVHSDPERCQATDRAIRWRGPCAEFRNGIQSAAQPEQSAVHGNQHDDRAQERGRPMDGRQQP